MHDFKCIMEERFRTTLLQYFNQVDKEKKGLTEDLRKIKEDFFRYEEEKIRYRCENLHKDKVIRKLTENGKLLVTEIERLKTQNKHCDSELVKIIAENNELRKKISFENDAIPHLENELRNLAEENQYLKLLSDDTKVMQQKDEEIQKFSAQSEHYKSLCEKYHHDLHLQAETLNKLSTENSLLKSEYKSITADRSKLYNELLQKQATLQSECCRLEKERTDFEKENFELRNVLKKLDLHLAEKQKKIEQLESNISTEHKMFIEQTMYTKQIEESFNRLKLQNEASIKDNDLKTRNLTNENSSLKQDLETARHELQTQTLTTDNLLYEDGLKKMTIEKLNCKIKDLLNKINEQIKREFRLQQEINDKQTDFDSIVNSKNALEIKIKDLETVLEREKDASGRLINETNHAKSRLERLENEVLSHTRIKCELEQELDIAYKTIETLRKSCELGDEQRNKSKKEAEHLREQISTLENDMIAMKIQMEESKTQYTSVVKKFESCEMQRNRLQKEIIILQKKLCESVSNLHTNNQVIVCEMPDTKKETTFTNECAVLNLEKEAETSELHLVQTFNWKDESAHDVENYYFQKTNQKLSSELKTLTNSIDSMKNLLSERDQRIDILSNQKRQCEVQFNVVLEELNDLKKSVNLYEQNIAQLNEEKLQLTKEIHKNGALIKDLKLEVEQKNNLFTELSETLALKNKLVDELATETAQKDKAVKELVIEVRQKDDIVKDLINEVSQKDKFVKELGSELNQKENCVNDLFGELAEQEILIADLQEKINQNNQTFDEDKRKQESQVLELQSKLEQKELIVDELEICVEKLQKEFDKLSENQNKSLLIELYSELDEKNREIYELEVNCKNLRDLVDSQQENIDKLNLHIQLQKEQKVGKEATKEKSTAPLDVTNLYNNCTNDIITTKKLPTTNVLSEHLHPDTISSSFDISSDTRDFSNKNAVLNVYRDTDFLKQTTNAVIESKTNDDINEQPSEVIVFKKEYLDALEALRQKDILIQELRDSIQNFEKENTLNDSGNFFDNTSDSNTMGRKTKPFSTSSALMELKLPQPGYFSIVQSSSEMESTSRNRTASLPTTPIPFKPPPAPSSNVVGAISIWAEERRRFELEKKELMNKFNQEIRLTKERNLKVEASAEDLRTEIVRLNSEVLDKKIEIRKLEDDLKLAQRKQERAEESYRKVVAKNETLEHEILENRRKIREVQAKRNASEVTELHYKRELNKLNNSAESLGEHCSVLIKEREMLEEKVKVQDRYHEDLLEKLKNSQREVDYWKHNVEMIQKECQELMSRNEDLENKNQKQSLNLDTIESNLRETQDDANTWKEKSIYVDEICGKLVNENRSLKKDLSAQSEHVQDIQNKLNEAKQHGDILNQQNSEYKSVINEFKLKVNDLEEETKNLSQQKKQLEQMIQGNNETQKELLTEKDIAENNSRYLQHKINELSQVVAQKENIISRHKEKEIELTTQLSEITEQLKVKKCALKQTTSNLDNELTNVERLEKLNCDMNKENKKLMNELLALKEKIQEANRENALFKDKIKKLEREQNNLDNMIAKTQKSNSELMESQQVAVEELKSFKNKNSMLEQEIINLKKEKDFLANKLLSGEIEFNKAKENFTRENTELVKELEYTRRSMGEFENILDQGQQDFDELENQLEVYRRENIELDEKLHGALKEHIRLQAELEELKKNCEKQINELETARRERDNEKHQHENLKQLKISLDNQLNERRNREDIFEERLRGYEQLLKSKEETLLCEKKEKETMQVDLIKFQKELIECITRQDETRKDIENKNKEIIEWKIKCDHFQNKITTLSSENVNLKSQFDTLTKNFDETQQKMYRFKVEKEELEQEHRKFSKHVCELELKLEDEQATHVIEKDQLLTELSALKRTTNEKDILNEKHTHHLTNKEKELYNMSQENEKLIEQIKTIEEEREMERQTLYESLEMWKDKANAIEVEMSAEITQLRATIDAMDHSNKNDASLIQATVQENKSLKSKMEEDKQRKKQNEMDIDSLKYDIVQLQNVVDSLEGRNEELSKQNMQIKDLLLDLEKKKKNIEIEKIKLMEDLNAKEEYIQDLQSDKGLTEKEKLNLTSEHSKLIAEMRSLKEQLINYEEIKTENESLKYDLEAILDERLSMQTQINELSHFRTDNYDLRSRVDRVIDMENENRSLKQDLREKELAYRDNLDKSNRENALLRRQVDNLIKKIQDLELRHVNFARSRPLSGLYFESKNTDIRPKAYSYDNLSEVGIDDFTPIKNATSTPTQDNKQGQASDLSRQPESSVTNTKQKLVEFRVVKTPRDDYLLKNDEAIKIRKFDSSYAHTPEEKLTLNIQSNPFLQRDKSMNSQLPKPINRSPTKSPGQDYLKKAALSFDMRPQSAETIKQDSLVKSPTKTKNGNDYVNKLKANFEKKQDGN
ncbi:putative leucine-rich repeat-containing protein DDB_G0290503 isoform X2 [Hydra vulgaris]|uniref:Leucine-rich repeat-containing protein DDB_G0290503 isoform X2 n=1 Tax=Hydra vulgaris TaxID=6087 RepID=A0ABM4BRS8_HYDVU